MKDMTDRELLDAMENTMRTVAERFRTKREAEAAASEPARTQPAEPAPVG